MVAGVVLASGGTLRVATKGRILDLEPLDTGATAVRRSRPWRGEGTRVEVTLGEGLADDDDVLVWARRAIRLARGGKRYKGRTSAWWYDADSFYELLDAAGQRTVREVVASFDGWAEPKAGQITDRYRGRRASTLSRNEAQQLLRRLREDARVVEPSRLGCIGRSGPIDGGYAREHALVDYVGRSGVVARVPVVVEAWAEFTENDPVALVHVNRTPLACETYALMKKTDLQIITCNVAFDVAVGRRKPFVWVNIETPFLPLTSDGKEPDLTEVQPVLEPAVARAIRSAKSAFRGAAVCRSRSVKSAIVESLPAAIEKASGAGQHRYSQRQLFYAVRPSLIEEFEKEPDYGYFCQVITDLEAERGGDLPGIYRDARGILYHPHTGDEISLGTRSVETYTRPEWTFKHVLYCEKEGLFPVLRDARFPERFDCALLTSKGFASRAARDVLDLLGDGEEEVTFFAVHDADGYGTKIYEALQEATRARPGRRVHVENLGLEPAEAREMDLQIETFQPKGDRVVPVAAYVPEEDRVWLQTSRVELNAMDSAQFLGWLEGKFRAHTNGKLVPPRSVLRARLREETRGAIEAKLTEQVLRQARLDERVARVLGSVDAEMQTRRAIARLDAGVRKRLADEPDLSWTEPIVERAERLAEGALNVSGDMDV